LRKYEGFTLLEVMVSLAIFAISGIGMMKVISEQLIWIKTLENRLISSWIADNILSEIKMIDIEQTDDWLKGNEFMVNKLWYWQSKEIKIQNEKIKMIIVEVRSKENNISPDFVLEGYRVINE
jgi:general secretion pathway protein I